MNGMPLLSETWRDIIALGSLAITIVGFVIAFLQIRKTRSAALAARDVANKVFDESRTHFQRHVLSYAMRFLAEAKLHANVGQWEKTAVRLGDLADQVSQLSDVDQSRQPLLIELRRWETKVISRPMTESMKKKWMSVVGRVQERIDSQNGPFKDPVDNQR